MPAKLDEFYKSISERLIGKVNPRTKKKYTDSDFWAIARSAYNQFKQKGGKK